MCDVRIHNAHFNKVYVDNQNHEFVVVVVVVVVSFFGMMQIFRLGVPVNTNELSKATKKWFFHRKLHEWTSFQEASV